MKGFIKNYKNENVERMNFGLINREYDDSLVEHIINCCKSINIDNYIKFCGYEYTEDESEIDLNEYMTMRRKKKKKKGKNAPKEDFKYMHMQDGRFGELRLMFEISCKNKRERINKNILIPLVDDKGYYTLKGKRYMLLYQLVDASTYTSRQNVVQKSYMPVSIRRTKREYKDTQGNLHVAPVYTVYLFSKEMDILPFYFARIGLAKTLEYFSLTPIVRFINKAETPFDEENNTYFQINSRVQLEVNKYFFEKHQYVRSLVFMMLTIVNNRLNFEDLEDKTHWVEKIGSCTATNQYNFYERGKTTMTFFERMIDEATKKTLKLHLENKTNSYSVVRWMIQNYNKLRMKDNLDLNNKRLRCNEQVASLLTKEFNERVNRVVGEGKQITIDKLKEIFKFQGDILIQKLFKSGLLRFDDRINDMDFFSKLRFTLKGPNSLGGKNENNISTKYRAVHPSHIGRLDINVCGSSDPGASGVIVPFCKTSGLYFDDSYEPEDGIYDFRQESARHTKESNKEHLVISLFDQCKDITEFFEKQEGMRDIMRGITVKETKHDDDMLYIRIKDEEEEGI